MVHMRPAARPSAAECLSDCRLQVSPQDEEFDFIGYDDAVGRDLVTVISRPPTEIIRDHRIVQSRASLDRSIPATIQGSAVFTESAFRPIFGNCATSALENPSYGVLSEANGSHQPPRRDQWYVPQAIYIVIASLMLTRG